ncbi:MAG: PQQ-binding-like beta-propeller repeat protein, partial [Gemmataceae bacterium]|nr:PQQ-binding-like beta-propeller repeat protein [Gemmataceae bacterium]
MSIIVQCPHCEMKFNVQADLVGKSLRCPNMGCRKVFKVQPLTAVEPEPPAGPAPAQPGTTSAAISHSAASSPPPQTTTPRSDSLTQEQVKTNKNRSSTTVPRPPTVARSPATGSKPPPLPSSLAHASAATTPDHQEVSEISQRTQADVGKSGEPDQAAPREVEWSAGLEAPEASVSPPDRSIQSETVTVYEQSSANELESLLLPERRRRSWAPLILIGLSISAILLLGFSAFYLLYYQDLAERQLAATAEENYKQGNYAAAAKDYEQLAQGYPNSPEAEKYRFFADLSRLQAAVRVVTNRQDYTAALTQWEEFVGTYRQSPWAKPNSGYGHDILEAGKKLCEDMIYVADEQLQKFRNDRTNQSALEGEVRKAIPKGRELVKTLETFRAADDPPLDKLRQEWERLEEELQREESRRQALAQARQHLQTVTDARIAQAESALAAAGWLQDPEAQALLNEARTRLRALIRYEPDPAAAQTPPVSMTRNIYCIAAMGTTARLAPSGAVEGTSAVFPIVARGILYALDEDSGQLLWAARVGTDITYTPTQARLALPEGVTEGLICPIHAGGQYGLAAYLLRSGELRWYQTLPAPAAAPPVVVGSRAYVAVRDELGTVYEFDVSDGTRRGRIRLGQPLAFLIAAPEGRYLYAAAEARRVFTLDAGSRDEADALLPLQCVQVIHTGHEPGTLRSAPVILDVPALAAAGTERRLLLCQANGARSMKLRLFTLPPLPPGLPADGLPPE